MSLLLAAQRMQGSAVRGSTRAQRPLARPCRALIDRSDSEKLEQLAQQFRIADVDGNGTIDREELRNILQSMDRGNEYMFANQWVPDEDLDAVMEKYDANKDGVISLDEFMQIAYDGLLLDGTFADYEAAFNAVDTSGNGTIGANELAGLFAKLGSPMSMEALVDVMQKYDKDESGQIEFSEFLLMIRDKALDLKAMKQYMTMDSSGSASGAVIEPETGGLVMLFSEAELDELLAKTKREGKLLMVFTALTWCRPCKAMQRPVQKMADLYSKDLIVAKLFGNANGRTKRMFKERLEVRSTPCFIILKDGEVVFTQTGSNKEKLERNLRSLLPEASVAAAAPLYPPED